MITQEKNSFEDPEVAQEWISMIENMPPSSSRHKTTYPFIENFIRENNAKNVLEIGSGQGVCSECVDDSVSYVGLEPSPYLNKRAEELYKNERKSFIEGNAYDLPFDSEKFDIIFSVGVWFHLENITQASKEIARVLKPGGKFVIFTSNPNLFNVWSHFFIDPKIEGKKITGKISLFEQHMTENIMYNHSKEEMLQAFENAGLTIEESETFGGTEEHADEGIWIRIVGRK